MVPVPRGPFVAAMVWRGGVTGTLLVPFAGPLWKVIIVTTLFMLRHVQAALGDLNCLCQGVSIQPEK